MKAESYEMNQVLNFERHNAFSSNTLRIQAIIAEVFLGSPYMYQEQWDGTLEYLCDEERECIQYWMQHLNISLSEINNYRRK
jgi:hypothetical protein